jgi:UDPglucose--hexose-1-phosphate uridylyltransferase
VPELRFDPLGRRQILLAPERAQRGAPTWEPFEPDPAPCDFCGGREGRTPAETFSIRDSETAADTPGWSVRVVPNLYPATALHEVVIHTPDHYEHFEDQDLAHRVDVLRAYRSRIRSAPTAAVVAVWNRGKSAGASRSHPHGQIFGLDVVPPTLEREIKAFGEKDDLLPAMSDDPDLCVAERDGARIVAHPVPFVAEELLIVPPYNTRLEGLGDGQLELAADLLAETMERLLRAFGRGIPFNLVVHTAPRGVERFHWHAHLMPRTAVWGGLEMGAELPIVAADPYETARRLRGS